MTRFEITSITVRYLSDVTNPDIRASLKSDAVSGKTLQVIAPKFSKDGRGHMTVWLDDTAD